MTVDNKTFRIIAGVAMSGCIVWGYWWLTWVLAISLLFIFYDYYEIILWGIIYDAIYGLPLSQFYNMPYIFSISSIVLFTLAFFLRRNLIAYK